MKKYFGVQFHFVKKISVRVSYKKVDVNGDLFDTWRPTRKGFHDLQIYLVAPATNKH